MADKEFKLGIVIDSSGAIKGIEDATGALVKFNKATDESADGLDSQGKSFEDTAEDGLDYADSLDTAFAATTAINQALEIGKKVFGALSDAIKETTAAYSVQELAEAGVANALKLTGQFTESGLQGWKDWASALQNVTTTGDEATLEMVKTATALGLNEEQTKKAITASLDLAAATGKNVEGTFAQLLQTYSGTAVALSKLGIDTSMLTKEQIKSGGAVDLVAKKFDGLAEAQTKTFTGASIQSANAYGDVVEEIGKLFVEVLGLAESAQAWAQFWSDAGKFVSSAREELLRYKDVVEIVKTSLIILGKPLLQAIALTALLAAGLVTLWAVVKLGPANIIGMAKAWLLNFGAVMKNVAAHAVLAAKFIVVAAAIAAVVVAIDLLIRNWDNLAGLGQAAADGFALFFLKIESGFAKLVFKLRKQFRDFARSLGLDALADQLNKALGASSERIKLFRALKSDMRKELEGSLEGIDTGIAGQMAEGLGRIKDVFASGDLGGGADKVKDQTKAATAAMDALGESSVKAAEKANKATEKVRATAAEIGTAIQGIKSSSESVQIDVFGNSFEKAQQKINDTATVYAEASALFVEKGDTSAASVDKLSKALAAVQTAEAQAKSLRIKTISDVVKANQSATIDLLKSSGDIVAAVEMENKIKLDALEKEHAAILKNLDLTDAEKKAITDQTKLLQEQNKVRLQEAQKKQKAAGDKEESGGGGVQTIQFANEGQLQALQDSFGAATSSTVGAMAGASSAIMGSMTGIFAAMDIVSGMMSAVISIPEKFTAFFTQLTNFGPMLATAIKDMFGAFTKMISDMIPNLIDAVVSVLASIGDFLGDALPDAFESLAQKIPEALMKFIQGLPSLIKKLATGFIRIMFGVLPKMVMFLLKAIPGLINAIAKMIPELVEGLISGLVESIDEVVTSFVDFFLGGGAEKVGKAIIMALANLPSMIGRGLQKALKRILNGVKIPVPEIKVPPELTQLPDKIKEAVKGVGEGIKAGGGDVFALVDLAKVKSAKSIDKSIGDATKRAAKQFKQTFQTIGGQLGNWLKKLREAWLWVWNNIIMPLVNGLKAIWMWIYENIILPIVEAIKAVWQLIYDTIIEPFLSALQAVWELIYENVILPLIEGIKVVWEFVYDNIILPFVSALQTIWSFVEDLFETYVTLLQKAFDFLKGVFEKYVNMLKGIFDFLKGVFEKYVNMLKSIFEFFKGIFVKYIDLLKKSFEALAKIFTDAINGLNGFITKFVSAITSLPGKAVEFANKIISMVGNIGGTMWNSFKSAFGSMGGVIKDHLMWAFEAPFKAITGVFSKVFDGVPDGGSKGPIEGLMNTNIPVIRFADGGIVPGTSPFPGDNKKNDSTVALLSPGEAVIPRTALADPQIARLVQSIMEGNVAFAFKGLKSPVKVSVPSAPKLPSINDIKKLSPADLAKNIESNLNALKNLATGDLWDLFKDKIFGKVKEMMESIMKSAGGFEEGGMIPNTGLAMVHQNEAVLPAGLVDSLMGNSTNNNKQSQNITLNATVNMVGADVAGGKQSGKKIIDEMFTELRKRSANQKIMFQSGLIS